MDAKMDRLLWTAHHPPAASMSEGMMTGASQETPDDHRLVERAREAFRRSFDVARDYAAGSPWRIYLDGHQRRTVEVFLDGSLEEVAQMLRRPHTNHIMYGFEDIYVESFERYTGNPALRHRYASKCKDVLVRLAEALGVLRLENPEGGDLWNVNMQEDVDRLLGRIELMTGIDPSLPSLYEGYCGLASSRGVITERMLTGLYAAHRIGQMVPASAGTRVLEIGAGLGHLARYAFQRLRCAYTIVDLPLTNMTQAYFLGRLLGEENIVLDGEPKTERAAVRIISPSSLSSIGKVDLVVNIDGLTEYGFDALRRYVELASQLAPRFMSINHEVHSHRVHDVVSRLEVPHTKTRFPFWLRNGYVEEVVEFGVRAGREGAIFHARGALV